MPHVSDANLAVVAGEISADPTVTELRSGSVVYSWSVRAPSLAGATTSVPVVATDPPAAMRRLGVGQSVLVVGAVRRRFFTAGGVTQSRTEVLVRHMVSASRPKGVAAALATATAALEPLLTAAAKKP